MFSKKTSKNRKRFQKNLRCSVFDALGKSVKTHKMMNDRSHAMNISKRKKMFNLIKKKVNGKVVNISARGLRTLKKKSISLEQVLAK